jgi:predicted transcriptional regulator
MIYFEDAAINLIPAIRALIARELKEKYHLTQEQIAKLLDITQPAVSQYLKEARGKKARKVERNEKIMRIVEEVAFRIYNRDIKESEIIKMFCKVCKLYSSKDACFLES